MDGSASKPTQQDNGFRDLHRESQALLRYSRRLRLRADNKESGAGERSHGAHRPTTS